MVKVIEGKNVLIATTSVYLDAQLFTFNLRDFKKKKNLNPINT